ncbi:MAG: basic amino acid ABC transporter substrate-binding protein [Clostridia bacterium]
MKHTKILALILALALAVCAFAACGQQDTPADVQGQGENQPAEKVIMGTQIGFPPFEYMDDNGDPAGFDIDLSYMIAEKAGKELQIEDMDFNGLIAALQSGKIDFTAAGMSVTEERKKNVDFSDPYYTSRQVIVVPVDSTIAGKEDLEGKTVAVQEGTTGEAMVVDEANAASVASFKKNADVAMEVLNGRADAFVLDEEPAKAIVSKNADKIKVLDVEFGTEEYAIAVQKGNTELLDIVNATIREMMEDGTYDEMIAKYFPDRAVEEEVPEEVVEDPAQ